jgi:hypothetical protein
VYSGSPHMDEWYSDGLQQISSSVLRPGTDERVSNSRSETERNLGFYCAQALKNVKIAIFFKFSLKRIYVLLLKTMCNPGCCRVFFFYRIKGVRFNY